MSKSIDTKLFSFIDSSQHNQNDTAITEAFNHVAADSGQVDNMYKAMLLSPNVIKPIHDLYLAIAHDQDCPFAHWEIELLSVQVAILNNCPYALAHHCTNLHHYINNKVESDQLIEALENNSWADVLKDNKLIAMLDYGKKLCLNPDQVNRDDIHELRNNGLTEKEIVFVAQINSAYAYWTRILNALGVEIGDEPLGIPIKLIKDDH